METQIYIKLKKKYLLGFLIPLFTLTWNLQAQAEDRTPADQIAITVTGTVISAADGSTLPGVTIQVKGTTQGTVTDIDGRYEIEVESDGILIFSYIGFGTQEIEVNNRSVIDVAMEESASALDEVVVTALGIKREEKSLGYSVERISGENVQRVAQENVLSALAGKVAGVSIANTGGAGSSVNMVIRGATSLSTDNQPLFVIDGVPISSSINNVGGFGGDNRVDYGNAIADLNPNDIEDISILKGPSAAALYGTRAGNGVVLITTKRAIEGQPMKITLSSNTVFDLPYQFLNTQSRFNLGAFSYTPEAVGSGILPEIEIAEFAGGIENDKGYWAVQWDSPLDANGVRVPTEVRSYPNNVKNFLNDYALTTTNSASISNSNPYLNYRLGFTNMTHSGIVPNSDLHRNSLSLAASSTLKKKLTISTNINFTNSYANNRPASNRGANPLEWAYKTPPNANILDLRDYGSGNDILTPGQGFENPYFLAYDVNNSFDRYRIFGNVSVNWQITPSWELMARYSLNKSDQTQESKIAPGGYSKELNNGTYGIATSNGLERNIDLLATYSKDWNFITLSASGGGNMLYSKGAGTSTSAIPGAGLIVPNVFTINNIKSEALSFGNSRHQRGINSIYGMATIGINNMAYIDVTARNDWSSTLPAENRSYFYPSTSVSLLIDQMIGMGNNVDMLKLRGGWAQVGNDTGPYRLLSVYGNAGQWGDAIRLTKSSSLLSPNLLPEESTSIEYGLDLIMFSNRLRFEGTIYSVDNKNQILGVPLAASTGYSSIQVNTGLLQSKGVELLLGFTPLETKNWQWDLNFNFTKNDTWVIDLADEVDFIEFWSEARVKNIAYVKDEANGQDGRVGNLYTRKVKRVEDKSSPYYNYPILGSGLDAEWEAGENYELVGNYNPDFIMGLQTGLRFKNFSLNATFDWRSGGQFVSQTMRYLSEGMLTETWIDRLVHPGDLGGKPSKELKEWVLANADEFIFSEYVRPIGGPTPEFGGFPENFSGYTLYDATFAPGVMGSYDENGKFILEQENLGDVGTSFIPFAASYPWDLGLANMFDADYIKLREISISYHFPNALTQRWGIGNLDLSLYSRNIMLWVKDSPLRVDPERAYQAERSGRFSQGVERFNVEPWMMPIGFKLNIQF